MTDKQDAPVGLEDTKADEVVVGKNFSKSMVTDRRKERWRVWLVTMCVLAAAASYIVMTFIALPLAIHTIVNLEDGCNPAIEVCFAPVERSQQILTSTLLALRLSTFVAGSLLGTLSDRYGRKPLLLFALLGYVTAGLFFLVGWNVQNTTFFVIGAIILGSSSPVTPHGVAYVADISTPSRLPTNLSILQGYGYFFGLMTGALISLALGAATTGVEENLESYSSLFNLSFAAGTILSFTVVIIAAFLLPESLHPDDRIKKVNWTKSNPVGFVCLVSRAPYFFLIWLSAVFAWCSVGAGEAVIGGWWLRRYAIVDSSVFILYIVLIWVSSGFGAAFCTKLYLHLGGLKFAVHVSAFMTVITGVVFAIAPTATASYAVVALSFFSSAVLPTTLAVLMGQVDSTEKGTLAGATRSSEALAKVIGIALVGNAFARYIQPFTPDASCIPDTFAFGVDTANSCECGVQSCPVVTGFDENGVIFEPAPATCALGELSQIVAGSPSKFVGLDTPADQTPVPRILIEQGLVNRPDECLGPGLTTGEGGFDTAVPRSWCASESSAGALVNSEIGCPGFDLEFIRLDEAFHKCDGLDSATGNCTDALFEIFDTTLQNTNYTPYHDVEDLDIFIEISQRVLDPDFVGSICDEEFGRAEVNVCLLGPIASFPGLFPMMFMGLLALLGYLSFIIAEVFFISSDKEYWKEKDVSETSDSKESWIEKQL